MEVNLLEAGEYSLKIGVRLPRSFLRRRAVQLLVATLGGPELDILGPKKEYVSYNGGRLVHQVKELLPDTRYTVEVSLADGLLEPAKLEARTAPATTCQFAEEDWGRSFFKLGAEGKDAKKDRALDRASRTTMSTALTGRSDLESPMTVQSVSGDRDDSTVCPSETDGVEVERTEWDFSPEEVCRQRVVEDDVLVEEFIPPSNSIQCNLCSLIDCFRLRPSTSSVPSSAAAVNSADDNEMLFSNGRAEEVLPVSTSPRRRPRPPFPGVAVDPASVGLELLPILNESQLQHVVEARAARARSEMALEVERVA